MHKTPLFPEQQLAKPQIFVGKLKVYRRGLRWVVLFVLVAYGLASCMVTRTLAIMGVEYITGYSPTYTDFPLGQNKRLNLEVRSYIKHLYCIGMRTEFIDGKTKLYGPNLERGPSDRDPWEFGKQEVFRGHSLEGMAIGGLAPETFYRQYYTFQVTAYRQGWFGEKVFFRKDYTNLNIMGKVFYSYGSNTDNPRNLAYQDGVDCFDLPYGKYRFEFVDNSPPIPEFKEVMTAVDIHPYINLK
ncbi:hypothetical protein A7P92_04250 [Eikenella corrodens]|uniref:hypothetical protein n=1 Tax=Eikenella corrodens TaxID=539 RepID=UPI0007D09E57|nr:hypothetical protein [Eikenella corrodens]OAM24506.1 hypothetical protein A7P92_04250 [Eikenella corrodens]